MIRRNWIVYRLTSPSGGSYIGITGQPLAHRWGQHQRAVPRYPRHPLYLAIKKYGRDGFQVNTIKSGLTEAQALKEEVASIAAEKPRYNLSPGGELDRESGRKAMAVLMSDPAWATEYRARVSAGCRNSKAHRERVALIAQRAAKWREENPDEAYALAIKGLEKANEANRAKNAACLAVLPDTLKKLSSVAARRQEKLRWAKCEAFLAQASEEYRAEVGPLTAESYPRILADRARIVKQEKAALIAQSLRTYHKYLTAEELAVRDARLADTRENIDHKIRLERQARAFERYRATGTFAKPTT